jgi:alginate O-acetyltransferase complex protein AlgI
MAIGLAKMFGFEFPENFNMPYIAKSIQEFWRRWHISLSSWFRDYLYISLGGNRASKRRTYINLFIVFLATGFWHGASWSFVVWGLLHGLFLIIERSGFDKILKKLFFPLPHLYTLLIVLVGWVLFRSDTLTYALNYLGIMFGMVHHEVDDTKLYFILNSKYYLTLIIGLVSSTRIYYWLKEKYELKSANWNPSLQKKLDNGFQFTSLLFYISILILTTMFLVSNSYNPFIYYKF